MFLNQNHISIHQNRIDGNNNSTHIYLNALAFVKLSNSLKNIDVFIYFNNNNIIQYKTYIANKFVGCCPQSL